MYIGLTKLTLLKKLKIINSVYKKRMHKWNCIPGKNTRSRKQVRRIVSLNINMPYAGD